MTEYAIYENGEQVGIVRSDPYEWEYSGDNESVEAVLAGSQSWRDSRATSEGEEWVEMDDEQRVEIVRGTLSGMSGVVTKPPEKRIQIRRNNEVVGLVRFDPPEWRTKASDIDEVVAESVSHTQSPEELLHLLQSETDAEVVANWRN